MSKKPKQYKIDSFEKLLENIDNISVDFSNWLRYTNDTYKRIRLEYPSETKGKSNTEILESAFIWIDDKKNDFKEVQLTNKSTGEIKEIKFNQKHV